MTAPALAPAPDPAEAPLDAPELSVRAVGVLLLHFQKSYGAERLAEVWKRNDPGLPLEHVTTITNFVSLRFIERVIEMLVRESGDPDFAFKAGLRTASPEALGFLFHIFRTFGSPQACYRQLVQLGETFNKVGAFQLASLERTRMELTYTSRIPERTPYVCEGRKAQFASIPMIWSLPAAKVVETECQVRGAPCCRYKLEWTLPVRAWRAPVGLFLGALAGAGLVWAAAAPIYSALPACVLAGVFAGAWLDSRQENRRKDELLQTQNEGLMESLRDLQRRNEEIFKTNQELERRVEERTHELSVANEQLSASFNQLQELDRLKTQFFDNVSHELRTPLTLILLTLESLKQTAGFQPSVEQHFDRMERSAARLLRLINELLDLAKIGAGKMRLRYQPVDLRELVNAIAIPFRVLADEKRISFELDLPSDLDTVHADFEKLDLVFQNLISNALKFTEAGEVKISVSQDAFYVHVTVRDTGAGIAPEDLGIIFDRFAQADASGTRRLGGTGIGLALVKETVELHGGNIRVESEPGKGSNFVVALPRGTEHIREELRERRAADVPVWNERRAQEGLIRQRRQWAAKSISTREEPEAAEPAGASGQSLRPTVLVVEDETELRSFIANALRPAYEVVTAINGEEGLARARECNPAAIVTDVMMPRMSGLQLLAALRADPRTVDTPIILLTARHDVDARVHGLGEGANDYLGKPFSPRELIARIEAQLRLREASARVAQSERLAAASLITSGFAHEVRNPLNGLMNALEPLKESLSGSADNAVAGSMIQVLEESGQRIRHLAESLLSLVRDSGGRQPLRLAETFAAAERALRWKLSEEIKIEQQWESEDLVVADPAAITQVWINLLDNASRALAGVPDPKIRVEARRDGNHVVFTLADNGCGILPEHLPRLFEPFFSTRTAGEGTGLGLALCRRIVLAHGGRISVESTAGEGTRVIVRFPLPQPGSDVARAESPGANRSA